MGRRRRGRAAARTTRSTGAPTPIYDLVDGKLVYRSHFKMPAPQVDEENCVAHNGSIVPVPGRDIMVQSLVPGRHLGVGFHGLRGARRDRVLRSRPRSTPRSSCGGGYWSSYWYDGRIYATEIVRGLDVFALQPSEFLTENEIAAAALADQGGCSIRSSSSR